MTSYVETYADLDRHDDDDATELTDASRLEEPPTCGWCGKTMERVLGGWYCPAYLDEECS